MRRLCIRRDVGALFMLTIVAAFASAAAATSSAAFVSGAISAAGRVLQFTRPLRSGHEWRWPIFIVCPTLGRSTHMWKRCGLHGLRVRRSGRNLCVRFIAPATFASSNPSCAVRYQSRAGAAGGSVSVAATTNPRATSTAIHAYEGRQPSAAAAAATRLFPAADAHATGAHAARRTATFAAHGHLSAPCTAFAKPARALAATARPAHPVIATQST